MSYRRLSKKPLLFRSFTGLTVSEFDDIYEKIESKYEEYERTRRQCLSEDWEEENKKKIRKRDVGAGRPFKLKTYLRFMPENLFEIHEDVRMIKEMMLGYKIHYDPVLTRNN